MAQEAFEKLSDSKKEVIRSVGIRAFSEKSYQNVSTDSITKDCGISKGLLFHYFGSKKGYYQYCLEYALQCLTEKTEDVKQGDFYDILFENMNRKIQLCKRYPYETRMVNMASRDPSVEVSECKAELFPQYMGYVRSESQKMIITAFQKLSLRKDIDRRKAAEGLQTYIRVIVNRFLMQYQHNPDQFFDNTDAIKAEMRQYLDMMLYGVCEKEAL